MTESVQQAVESHTQAGNEESPVWQTPDYVVVETALEVTAYALSNR
ncbi:pyrroloquinoline quinone precursor peptide PqqA [Streptomyces spongiae]|uniref:Coenzyme PQQ synthesis protein A n=1 Tax=Streptomyces spongiae TaxID=565072 RepID=A0A5N8XAM6_9ACTN|nr:pyrroloquinoline quinone precursor peptide PqqA [Streptomyces spongiae]MPY56244.1 pyrroloquinoline quinone precursor peptide PqqA [Streptomyces spongiae]